MSTYTTTPSGDVVLCMTASEARGLLKCADEGAQGLLVPPLREVARWFDYQTQREAAARALAALGQACVRVG